MCYITFLQSSDKCARRLKREKQLQLLMVAHLVSVYITKMITVIERLD